MKKSRKEEFKAKLKEELRKGGRKEGRKDRIGAGRMEDKEISQSK